MTISDEGYAFAGPDVDVKEVLKMLDDLEEAQLNAYILQRRAEVQSEIPLPEVTYERTC